MRLKKEKIGILGGSFDPAHKGHLVISKEAIKRLKLKKIVWAITKKNPFKSQSNVSLLTRIKYCKKIINKNPRKFRPENSTSSFRLPHVVNEEKKEVWVYIPSGFPTTLAVPHLMKIHYPGYKSCLCNRETFIGIGGKL